MTPPFIAIRPAAGVPAIPLPADRVVEVRVAVVGDAGEINFSQLKSMCSGFNGCAVTTEPVSDSFRADFFKQILPIN